MDKFYRQRKFFGGIFKQNLPREKSVIKVNQMFPNKTNYSQEMMDIIDAKEIERSSKLANKGITDNELKSETFISTKAKKTFARCFRKPYNCIGFTVIRPINSYKFCLFHRSEHGQNAHDHV